MPSTAPPLTPATGYHGGGVFKDESAPAAERYKMIYQGTLSATMQQRYQRRRPDAVGAFIARRKGPWSGLMGAVSPDGLQWTPLAEVLVAQISDTHNVCEYDPVLGQYVAYCRNWFFNRRTIGRIAADQFADFPLSEEVFWPGTLEQPFEVWYLNAKTRMPGTTDYHLMFPTRWSIADDRFDFFMATSPDNITWNLVPGGPVCTPGASGAWDGGLVGPGLGLVELPDARMGIPLVGSPVPHKHPRRPPLGALAWAWWRWKRRWKAALPCGRSASRSGASASISALHPAATSRCRPSTATTRSSRGAPLPSATTWRAITWGAQ